MPKDLETAIGIIKICLVITGVCVTIFPILYAMSPWYRSHLGRAMMIQSLSVAFAIDISVIRSYWLRDIDLTTFFILNVAILAFISVASIYLTMALVYYNFMETKEIQMSETSLPVVSKPFLTDTMYNRLKWVAQIGLPALGTLYFTLSKIWGLPSAEEVVGTIVAVDTFLGLLLGLSTSNYNKSEARFDGIINVTEDLANNKKVFNLELKSNPEELENKDTVVFKVTSLE
jgi:hypothetical protein